MSLYDCPVHLRINLDLGGGGKIASSATKSKDEWMEENNLAALRDYSSFYGIPLYALKAIVKFAKVKCEKRYGCTGYDEDELDRACALYGPPEGLLTSRELADQAYSSEVMLKVAEEQGLIKPHWECGGYCLYHPDAVDELQALSERRKASHAKTCGNRMWLSRTWALKSKIPSDCVTVPTAAKEAGVGVHHVYHLISLGKIEHKIVEGVKVVPRAALQNYIDHRSGGRFHSEAISGDTQSSGRSGADNVSHGRKSFTTC